METIGKQQAQPSPAQSSAAQPSRENLEAQSFENQKKIYETQQKTNRKSIETQ